MRLANGAQPYDGKYQSYLESIDFQLTLTVDYPNVDIEFTCGTAVPYEGSFQFQYDTSGKKLSLPDAAQKAPSYRQLLKKFSEICPSVMLKATERPLTVFLYNSEHDELVTTIAENLVILQKE
mmetsp:Transcript_2437/g.2044  ORF Transcript_2437/g.2044 Transcript_2437/m.2044 type:complete len:123 (-) Transcript_2437:79-447(-)